MIHVKLRKLLNLFTTYSEIFEVPLSFVLNPANQKIETRYIRGVDHDFYVLLFENFYIWGLTARLLVALRDTLEIK